MERHATQLMFELLEMFPCVAIMGVRQCGKTTILSELPDKWRVFDLEKMSDYEIASRDPDLFLRLNPAHIAIDECQLLPEFFPALRVAIDADRTKNGRFIITGSSSPSLLRAITESLAGRVAMIELAPFSRSEAFGEQESFFYELLSQRCMIDDFKLLDRDLDLQALHEFWLRGGYPEPWIKSSPRFRKVWMQNYLKTYFERDLLRLFPGINQQRFRHFLQMLSHLSGTIINYSQVARALSVSQPTARDYFEIANGTFIWRQIPAYEKNAVKRIVKHPKGYLRDSGLLHFHLHLTSLDDLLSHPGMGQSWESMVIETIIRGLNNRGIVFDYYYYRTGGGAEIDLILDGEFGLVPVEIKYSQTVSGRELRSIGDFVKERKCRYGIVVHNSEKVTQFTENLIGIPFGCL